MAIGSLEFLLLLLLGAGLFPLVPQMRCRQLLHGAASLAFLGTQLQSTGDWAAIFLFVLSGYATARLLHRIPNVALVAAYIILVTATFLWLQKYDFLHVLAPARLLAHPLAVVGISYMLFRQVHFVVDVCQGQIARFSLWDYLNYQLSFLTLLAGPIQRFQKFGQSWATLQPSFQSRHDLHRIYLRLFGGFIKLAGLGVACLFVYEKCSKPLLLVAEGALNPGRLMSLVYAAGTLYSYPAYVYFNFSGYCDVVIAGGALLGLSVPENFDRPYLSRNMIDYWTRWHMTLTVWIRDYVFTPLYMLLAGRVPAQAPSLAFLCYFVALFLAGVWHGSTWNWVVFGLLNGLGVSGAKLWEMWLVRRGGRRGLQNYLRHPVVRVIAIFGTLHFACLTIVFFPANVGRSVRLLHGMTRAILG
jgi:D-alanyl-lipoteichoic acid acyltransferase DltB (MBOAT superfamily)